ncbi:Uncharacterised protein [Xylophilus ampelinus]|nr:Uncharacterised protein [Xylophilus ampelinus]
MRIEPGRRFLQRLQHGRLRAEHPARIGGQAVAHGEEVQALDLLAHPVGGLRIVQRGLPAALPQVDARAPAQHRALDLVAAAGQRRQRLVEAGVRVLEAPQVAQHAGAAGHGVGDGRQRRAAARPALAHGVRHLVQQLDGTAVVGGRGRCLAQRGAGLDDERRVLQAGGVVERLLAVQQGVLGFAQGVVQVGEPVLGIGLARRVAVRARLVHRAAQQRLLVARRIEHGGEAQPPHHRAPELVALGRRGQAVEHLEGGAVLRLRAVDGRGRHRLVAGHLGVARCGREIGRAGVVVGQRLALLELGRAIARAQQLRHAPVHVAALLQAQGAVHHVARDAVLEAQGAGLLAGEEQVLRRHGGHQRMLGIATGELLQQPGRDHVADDGRRPEHRALLRRQARHARFDQRFEPGRPAAQRIQAGTRIGRQVAQLLEEERIAAGMLADAAHHEGVGVGQQRADRRVGLRLRQRPERQHLGRRQLRIAQFQRARGQQHQQRQVGLGGQGVDDLAGRVVGPLPIVDEKQLRRLPGQHADQPAQHLQHLLRLRGGRRRRVRRLGRQRQLGVALAQLGRQRGDHTAQQRRRGQACGGRAQAGAQHLQEGLQGLGAEFGLAVAAPQREAAGRGVAQEFLGQACLADARGSRDHHQPGTAAARGGERPLQGGEFGLAPDEVDQTAPRLGLEARAQRRAREDAVHRQRVVAAFEREPAGLGLEQVAGRAQRLLADQDLVALGDVAQMLGDAGGGAEELEAPGDAVGAFAHQHQSGVDAAVHVQHDVLAVGMACAQRAHALVHLQRRLGRAQAVVLARLGMAEQGLEPVALVLVDGAAAALDHLVERATHVVLQGREHFRLQQARQARGIRQVGEQHRHVPAQLARRALHHALDISCHGSPNYLGDIVSCAGKAPQRALRKPERGLTSGRAGSAVWSGGVRARRGSRRSRGP